MITDQVSKLCDSVTVRATDPDYSSAYDLTVSPDMGSGKQLYAIIHVEVYDDGTSSGTTISVVTSANSALTSNRKVGQFYASAARLTALVASPTANLPIVVPILPDVYSAASDVSSVSERYIGIEFDHATAQPTTMTVTAYITDHYQSPAAHSHHAVGMKVL